MRDIKQLVKDLHHTDNSFAYTSFKQLVEESKESNSVYPFFDDFIDMLEDDNSYIRNRGLILIAENSRWDIDNKVDEVLSQYLKHITDVKPITARQCIRGLEIIVDEKEDLVPDIKKALYNANIEKYPSSMRELIEKDIARVLKGLHKKF